MKTCGIHIVHWVLQKVGERKFIKFNTCEVEDQSVDQVEHLSRDQNGSERIFEANEQPMYKEEVCFDDEDLDKRPIRREDGPANQEQIRIDDRANQNLPMGDDNEEFLRSLRKNIIHRVLEKVEAIETERLKGLKSLPYSKGRLLWKRLKNRLTYIKGLDGTRVKIPERQRRWVRKTMRDPVVSARKETNPPNEETVGLREGKKAEFGVEKRAHNKDIVNELDKQASGGTVYQEDKKGKVLTIGGKITANTEAPAMDAQKKFTYLRPHHARTKLGSPMDYQTTVNEGQPFTLSKGDFEAQARHIPMKSHLFRHSDHSNEQESIKKSAINDREPQIDFPVIDLEPVGIKAPLQHPKMVFKRQTGPRSVMSPMKFPFFSSDTLDQISWSEFTRDPENEGVTFSRPQSYPEMPSDGPVSPIVLISSPNVEDPQTNDDNVAFKSETTEKVELEPPPVMGKYVRSPPTYELLRRPSDQRQGDSKDGRGLVIEPLRLNFKKKSSNAAYLDPESIELPYSVTDSIQSKIQLDPSNLASGSRKFSLLKLFPIPEAVPIPLSSADKRIRQMGTHDKKGDGKEERSMMAPPSKIAMPNQRFPKLSTDKSVTVQHKRSEHVETPQSDCLKLRQSPQNRHRQELALGSAENPHETVIYARSQPKKQPEPASLPHSDPTSSKRNLRHHNDQ